MESKKPTKADYGLLVRALFVCMGLYGTRPVEQALQDFRDRSDNLDHLHRCFNLEL